VRRGWGSIGAMKDNAGTDVKCHAGGLLATHVPGQRTLAARSGHARDARAGPRLGAPRAGRRGSHYKVDEHTGEMMFFNYPEQPPYMNYGVIDRDNRLVHYVPIELPHATLAARPGHQRRTTASCTTCRFFDPEAAAKGQHKLVFHRDRRRASA
jgi:carotenoid cleavage dioxygenase-like enzyme